MNLHPPRVTSGYGLGALHIVQSGGLCRFIVLLRKLAVSRSRLHLLPPGCSSSPMEATSQSSPRQASAVLLPPLGASVETRAVGAFPLCIGMPCTTPISDSRLVSSGGGHLTELSAPGLCLCASSSRGCGCRTTSNWRPCLGLIEVCSPHTRVDLCMSPRAGTGVLHCLLPENLRI